MNRLFYTEGLELLNTMRGKQPNAAHKALAWLEQRSLVQAVITQNIDGLHYESGSKRVLEMHGNLRTSVVSDAGKDLLDLLVDAASRGEIPPKCRCGGTLRPDVSVLRRPHAAVFPRSDPGGSASRFDAGCRFQPPGCSRFYLPSLARQACHR